MSVVRMVIDGYGQIELNNCAFRRDGRIEAQCAPDATDFATAMVENGMLLAVDRFARRLKLPTDATLPIALNYSSEHIYDERTPGLKNFALKGQDDFLPRVGYPSVGDLWTTNCISYDTSEFADDDALIAALEDLDTTPLYAGYSADGAHLISATKPSDGPVLRAVEFTTMPDGTPGVKFQVYSC